MTQDNSTAQLVGRLREIGTRGWTTCYGKCAGDYMLEAADLIERLTRHQPSTSSVEAVARALRNHEDSYYDRVQGLHYFSERAVEAALAALPSPEREPMRWQPIESAPKDGTEILILAHGMTIQARYCPGGWSEDTPVNPAEYSGAIWCAFDDAVQFEIEETSEGDFHGPATHWMPLPAPPTAQSGDRT